MPEWVFSCRVSWLSCLETRLKEEPAVRNKCRQSGGLLERAGAMGAHRTDGAVVPALVILEKSQRCWHISDHLLSN